ncbi:hypothetical protein A9R05_05590 [Burkholderia sp. KK1]|nr:hypothetical protein A9R05_05590 [Burkholderia sp. KK1]
MISNDGLQAASLRGFVYAPDPGDFPNVNVGALMSSNVSDSFEIPITVGTYGEVWIQCAASNDSTKGTFIVRIDGVIYNVTDCNNKYHGPNAQQLVHVASGLSAGQHTLELTSFRSASGSRQNILFICGIATA